MMIKDFFFQLRHSLPKRPLTRKKQATAELNASFGKFKTEYTDVEKVARYFRNKDNSQAHQVLSDKTCNDLDFDDLFMFVDRTHSKVGQQYLYNTLRAITIDEQQTSIDEKIIDELTQQPEVRISIQKDLAKLNHPDAYFIPTLFQEAHIKPPKWFFLLKILSVLSAVTLILAFKYPVFLIVLIGIFCMNFVIHYWNKNNLVQYVSSLPQLSRLNVVAANLSRNPSLKKLNPKIATSIKTINEVKNRMAFFKLEARLQGNAEMIAWFFIEQLKTLFLIEPLMLFGILKRLDKKKDEIENVFSFVGHIDSLVSIASLRTGLDTYCIPTINRTDNRIVADDIRHPLIFNCTPNTLTIAEKSVLLTGSNMSGKTSFIRAIGLNVITGLTLNTCFAKAVRFPVLRVFSAIRISDDLMNDKSYYFEEVLTIKDMLDTSKASQNNLFLLDELFKGTNTVERISAGKAVLSKLAKNNNIVLVSTHDIELTDLLADEYELYHFSEIVNSNTVGFDYLLKQGKLKNRNAIRILEMNEYPKEVITEAFELSKKLDKFKFQNENN